jgi:hypothetical protein
VPRAALPISLFLAASLALAAAVPTAAAGKGKISGTVWLVPAKVGIGKPATLKGKGMPAGEYFAVLLAVPDDVKPNALKTFIRVVKTDRRGNLNVQFRMPVVPKCGRAQIDVFVATKPYVLHAPLTLTGCTVSKHPGAPPPPPPHKKR